jgi:hypothetical protein
MTREKYCRTNVSELTKSYMKLFNDNGSLILTHPLFTVCLYDGMP